MRAFEKEKMMNDSTVKEQYSTADKLNTRISIHKKYSTNKQGFGNWIFANYRIEEGMKVLEMGCGTGEMWLGQDEMIGRCGRLVLTDLSEGMIAAANEKLKAHSSIEFQNVDIQDIPFADHEFDVVIANMMLYHVPDLDRGLQEVARVLKSDGTFYCATYGENGIRESIELLFDDFPISGAYNYNFTLQNGKNTLEKYVGNVEKRLYEDSLEVTNVDDLIDYIYSLPSFSDIQDFPRDTLRSVLEKNMRNGVLHVPKDYGMFIARKG